MKPRKISQRVAWMGANDWNRRLFDALIPLPDGTSYNAYLVKGDDKTVLIDAADETMLAQLMAQLDGVERLDYIISQHAEQDHAGGIPAVLAKYPEAELLCSARAQDLLIEHLHLDPQRMRVVADGETLDLGGCSLKFIYTPWVHWPETMSTWLEEEQTLFSCDFFGSHLATSELYAGDSPLVLNDAKRYYAEIMMPFSRQIQANLKKLEPYAIKLIAPSHGPLYDKPEIIIDAYKQWSGDQVGNLVVIPYISMHGSTAYMVDYLVHALIEQGVLVQPFDLTVADIGEVAMSLVDAATIVIGTPTVSGGPHPVVFGTTNLVNTLKPKTKFAAIIGSYGWGTKAVEQLSALIPNIKAEILGTALCKGKPREADLAQLDDLAIKIAKKHQELGLLDE